MADGSSGSGAEGQPSLNPQARADIDQALQNANIDSLSKPFPSGRQEAPRGLESDPRLQSIKNELVDAWELIHGSRYDQNGVLNAEYQDFLYGKPSDLKTGKEILALEQRAEKLFTERFPDDARAYAEEEKLRVYEDPNADPAVKGAEKDIIAKTNRDSGVVKAQADYSSAWHRANTRYSIFEWKNFADKYPQKAAAYKDKIPVLQVVLEGQRKSQALQEPKVMNTPAGLTESTPAEGITAGLGMTHEGTQPNQGPEVDSSEQIQPLSLLERDTIPVDAFFNLDKDKVYNSIRRIASIHHDENMRRRAQKILDLIESGKDQFMKDNPGIANIDLT